MPVLRCCYVRLHTANVGDRVGWAMRIREVLAAQAIVADVGEPADDSAARWDLAIVIRCASLSAWQALAARPSLAQLFDHDLPAAAVVVKAWTFTIP